MKTIKTLLMLILPLIWSQQIHAQTYVDANATGANDGSSWADAYNTLHDALEAYSAGDEIWVAAGFYWPQQPSAWTGDPRTTFYLNRDVALYGGFNGTETMRSERDPAVNVTTLSGDLDGDDILDDFTANRSDNVLNVMFIEDNISNATVIDGFTISGGHANDDQASFGELGGGIWSLGSPQVRQCHFTQNFAVVGSGMYLRGETSADAMVSDCLFEKNEAGNIGAGLVIVTLDPNKTVPINNCEFVRNDAGGFGGALAIGASSTSITNCQFSQNSCATRGGGIYFQVFNSAGRGGFELTLTHSTFEGNTASGGGGFNYETDTLGENSITIDSCQFVDNQATGAGSFSVDGGAIQSTYNYDRPTLEKDSIRVSNSLFEGNTSGRVGGAVQHWNSTGMDNYYEIIGCEFRNNQATLFGGGLFSESVSMNASMLIEDCLFEGNVAGEDGGGAEIGHWEEGDGLTIIRNTQFVDNISPDAGAGLSFWHDGEANGSILLTDCLFSGNLNDSTGEAMKGAGGFTLNNFGEGVGSVTFQRCVFDGNLSADGSGAIQLRKIGNSTQDYALLDNCRLTNNTGGLYGGGIGILGNVKVDLRSNTIADNANNSIVAAGGSLSFQNNILSSPSDGMVLAAFVDSVTSLGGNLVSDSSMNAYLDTTDQPGTAPLFEANTYELSSTSPAIDAGIDQDVAITDLAGNNRTQGGCIDIGALESPFDLGMGCVATATPTNIETPLTASTDLSLYPNPATHVLTVALAGIQSLQHGRRMTIRIMNTMGQVVQTADMGQRDSMELDIRNLPAGTYRVMVSDGQTMAVASLMKQ